ncbi:MAG TPA: DUF192 domain-containing protein [Candidatus Limnocylindria bacterium]|nr:DUF192 domain-containing protein [Candidatus Limnocylindria bacterium]
MCSLVAGLLAACGTAPTAVLHGAAGPVSVRLEVARTEAARTKGLMYRRSLADGDGMLFVFDEARDHSFWMKNTFIPLDMIFIGEDLRVVGVHARAEPQSTQSISVGAPSRYVLEVPGGWAERHGVGRGTRVELHGVPLG